MPRKKATKPDQAVMTEPMETTATAVAEPPPVNESSPVSEASPPEAGERPFAPQFRAVFSSKKAGFKMGENYRFKQRVFSFDERPSDDIIATLKEHGFTYRPAEKSWTIPASAETRLLTDRLAREFASQDQSVAR